MPNTRPDGRAADTREEQEFKSYLQGLRRAGDVPGPGPFENTQTTKGGLDPMQKPSIEEQAIFDWKKYPALANEFRGPDQYADYIRCDFPSRVDRQMKEKKSSKAEAIRTVAREYPELHRLYIKVENIIQRGR